MIKAGSGKQFDPAVVDAFLEVEAEFRGDCRALPRSGVRRGRPARTKKGGTARNRVQEDEVAATTETPADGHLAIAMDLLDTYNDPESNRDAQEV